MKHVGCLESAKNFSKAKSRNLLFNNIVNENDQAAEAESTLFVPWPWTIHYTEFSINNVALICSLGYCDSSLIKSTLDWSHGVLVELLKPRNFEFTNFAVLKDESNYTNITFKLFLTCQILSNFVTKFGHLLQVNTCFLRSTAIVFCDVAFTVFQIDRQCVFHSIWIKLGSQP